MIIEQGECDAVADDGNDGGYDAFSEQLLQTLCPEGTAKEIVDIALVKFDVAESANEPPDHMCSGAFAARLSAVVNETQW